MDEGSRIVSTGIQEILGQMIKSLQCPICLELMQNPVSTNCNHRFCRSIEEQSQLSNVIQKIKQLIETFEADTGTKFSPMKNASTFFPSTPETVVTKRKSNAKRKCSAESSTRILRSRSCSSEKAEDQDTSRNIIKTKSRQETSARKKISYEKKPSEVHDDSESNVDNEGVTNIFKSLCEESKDDHQLLPTLTIVNSELSIPSSKTGCKSKEDESPLNMSHFPDRTDFALRSSDIEEDHHVELLQYLQEGSCGALHETNPLVCSVEKDIHVSDEGNEEIEPASSRKVKTNVSGSETRKKESINISKNNSSHSKDKLERKRQPRSSKVRSLSPSELEPQSQDFLQVQPVTRTYTRNLKQTFKGEKAKAQRRPEENVKEENLVSSSLLPEEFENPVMFKEQKKKAHSSSPRNVRIGSYPQKQNALLVEEIEHGPEVVAKAPPPVYPIRKYIFRNRKGLCTQDQEAKVGETVFPLTLSQDPFEFKGETPTKEVKKGKTRGKKGNGKKSKAPPLNFCHSYQQTEEAYLESNGVDKGKTDRNTHQLYCESDGCSVPYQKIDSNILQKKSQCSDSKASVVNDADMDSQMELFSGRDNRGIHSIKDPMCIEVMTEKNGDANNELKRGKKKISSWKVQQETADKESSANTELNCDKKGTSKRKEQQKTILTKSDEITMASQEIRKMQSKISEAEIHELMFSTQEAQKYIQEQQQVKNYKNEGSAGTIHGPVKKKETLRKSKQVKSHAKLIPVKSLHVGSKNANITPSQSNRMPDKAPDDKYDAETDFSPNDKDDTETDFPYNAPLRDNIDGGDGAIPNKGQLGKDWHRNGELANVSDTNHTDNSCTQTTVDIRENHKSKSEPPMYNHESTDTLTIIEKRKIKPQFSLPNLASMTPFNPMFSKSLPNSPDNSCKVIVVSETPLTGNLDFNSVEVKQKCDNQVIKEPFNNWRNGKTLENDQPLCKTTKEMIECSGETTMNISCKDLSDIISESKSSENTDLTNKTESQLSTCCSIVPISVNILPQKVESLCFTERDYKATLSLKSNSVSESDRDKTISSDSEINEDCAMHTDVLAPETCVEESFKQNKDDSHNPLVVTFIPETELPPNLVDTEVLPDCSKMSQMREPEQERNGQKSVSLNSESAEKNNVMSQPEQALTDSQPISSTYVVVLGPREGVANELPEVDSEDSLDSFSQGEDTMVSSAKSVHPETCSTNIAESLFSGENPLTSYHAESHSIRDKTSCSNRLNLSLPHNHSHDTEVKDKTNGPSKENHCVPSPEIVIEDMPQTCHSADETQDISDYENDECVLMFHSGNENSVKQIQNLPRPIIFGINIEENKRREAKTLKKLVDNKLLDHTKKTDGTYSEVINEEETSDGKCFFTYHQHLKSVDKFVYKSESQSHKYPTKLIEEEAESQKEQIRSGNSVVERFDAMMASNCHTENENVNSMKEVKGNETQSMECESQYKKNNMKEVKRVESQSMEYESQSILYVSDVRKNEELENDRKISEDFTSSAKRTCDPRNKSLRRITKPLCEKVMSRKRASKVVENSMSSWKAEQYFEQTSSPLKKSAWTTEEDLTPPKKKATSSGSGPTPHNKQVEMSRKNMTPTDSDQMDRVNTENLTPVKSQPAEEKTTPMDKLESSKKKTKRGLALKNNEMDSNSLPQHPNGKLSPGEKAALDLEFSKISKIPEFEETMQGLKESTTDGGMKDCHSTSEIQTSIVSNDDYSPCSALDDLCHTMCDVEKEMCRLGKDLEKSQRYLSCKETAHKDYQKDIGKRETIAVENGQEELIHYQIIRESSMGQLKGHKGIHHNGLMELRSDKIVGENSLEESNKDSITCKNNLKESNKDDKVIISNNLEELNRDNIEELKGGKVDSKISQDFDEETSMEKFNKDHMCPAKLSQHDGNVNQVDDVVEDKVIEKHEESLGSAGDIELSFDLGISLDEGDCDLLPVNNNCKFSHPDNSSQADDKPQKHPELPSYKETLQDNASSKASEIVEVEMVEESDLEDSPITVPKTSSPMMPRSDHSDVEESLICEDDDEEDENAECIVPPKKRRRLLIASDSEEESDIEKNNLSQDNATSSSALSSQSELLNTQQQEALEKDVVALQQDIAQCEAALQDIDDSGPQTQIPKAQSPSKKNAVEVLDEVDNGKKPSAVDDEEESGGENSEDDLFICISSPSPQKPQFSSLVQRVPVLSKENPGLCSKFFKQFQSPGGSVHKRRALEFTRQSSNTDRDGDKKSPNRPTSPVISSQGKRSGKLSCKSGAKTDSTRCAENYDDISLVASGLNGQEQEILKKFRHRFHVKFNAKFVPGVTHVIVKSVKDHNFMCERTLKFFQGLVHKAWILDFSWIMQSLDEGHILKEDEFEICGDTCTGELSDGPKKARLSSELLLTNFSFACIGNCNELPRNELKDLLVACGACVVEDIIALPLSSSRHKYIIRCNDSDEEPSDMEKIMLKSVFQQTGLLTLNRDWVLDCISSHQVIQVFDYQLKL